MVPIGSLFLPIVLSAVIVWVASFTVWVVLPHHRKDYAGLPDEEAARTALKGLAPGQYNVPHLASRSDLKTPEGKKRFEDGPVGFLTVLPSRIPSMAKNMILSFIFYIVVGILVAYLASRSMAAGEEYIRVFRFVSVMAWIAHGMAAVPDAIWFGRPWSAIVKMQADALLYGLLTGGAFAGFWPD